YVLLEYPGTIRAIGNTLWLATAGATTAAIASVILSWQIVRMPNGLSRILEFTVMIPVAIPGIVFSLGLLWAWIGIPMLPIYGTLWILFICYVTIFLPYSVRSTSAALSQIDRSLEESARVCGAR